MEFASFRMPLAIAMLGMAGAAAVDDVTAPCLQPSTSIEEISASFEADGWTSALSPEARLTGLRTAAEALLAAQNLSRVETPEGHDSHIEAAHQRAERLLADAAVMQRDGMFAVIEFQETDAGDMVRCTVAGGDLPEVAEAFAARADDISAFNGHEFLISPLDHAGMQADITWYRLASPEGATIQPLGPLAVIATMHLP